MYNTIITKASDVQTRDRVSVCVAGSFHFSEDGKRLGPSKQETLSGTSHVLTVARWNAGRDVKSVSSVLCGVLSCRLWTAHPPASSRIAENSCATSGWLAVLAKNQLLIMSLYFLRCHNLGSGLLGSEFRHQRMPNLKPNRDASTVRALQFRPACWQRAVRNRRLDSLSGTAVAVLGLGSNT